MSALLEIEGLEAGYGASQVLFGLDLAVNAGEVVTLLGRNGMGKTTTVRAIFGLARVRSGTIRWRGTAIDALPTERIAQLGIALVPEGRQIFPNLTVRENLVAFAAPRRAPWGPAPRGAPWGPAPRRAPWGPDDRAGATQPWTLERVWEFFPQLRGRAANLGSELSGGEQQMLAIGRALMTNPVLLILDEATEGLAPLVREEIWRCLDALRAAGQTLLVIDKHVERLVALADRHTILERGRVVWSGASAELAADRALWHRYLGL